MANKFVEKEVQKIINDKADQYPKNMALAAAWIIANFKGVNIKIYDCADASSLCDYNVIATANNITQAKTMSDEIMYNLKKSGAKAISVEGLSDADWVLIDLGDVIIHIFQEITREIFDLDLLWSGQPTIEIPAEYYYSHPEMEDQKESNDTENYF